MTHEGINYVGFFRQVTRIARPRTYLEIGTQNGQSLAAMKCDAICIDPIMKPATRALDRDRTFCFQMASDAFFRETDVFALFPHGIDVAFLDGMHRFEYLLRDLHNTERYCHSQSLVLIHDCFPDEPELAVRQPPGGPWTGDVWKIVPLLLEFRPDLHLRRLDCPPTGLLAVQGLSPEGPGLAGRYHEAVGAYAELSVEEYGLERLWDDVPVLESKALIDDESAWSLELPRFG